MKYQFQLTFTPTDGSSESPVQVYPLHSDDLAISIDRKDGEWYYTRKLSGTLTFVRDDYNYIMSRPFDGTFAFDLLQSTDGVNYYPYFAATFSRASLEIDEDNHTAKLDSLSEGIDDLLSNGKDEDFDLMKIIPDNERKTVQGQVNPALALIDECSTQKVSISDIYCGSPFMAGGYKDKVENYWAEDKNMSANPNGRLSCIFVEAKLTMDNPASPLNGRYAGFLTYQQVYQHGSPFYPDQDFIMNSLGGGSLYSQDGTYRIPFSLHLTPSSDVPSTYIQAELPNGEFIHFDCGYFKHDDEDFYPTYYSPIALQKFDTENHAYTSLEIVIHYIYSSLLTYSDAGVNNNILNVGTQYKGISRFQGSGLTLVSTTNTVDYPNGHRLVPGSDQNGATPRYFAPPDNEHDYIPVAENNWNYASLWYTIVPSVTNGLLDPSKVGTFTLASCWPVGTCLRHLLGKVSNHKIVFAESTDTSRFLYEPINPISNRINYTYLVTQKSNLMSSSGNAPRCIVRLNWFLELLRNAFNCYYWLEKRNDGKYDFRIEHVEYFRNGGSYTDSLASQLDLTTLKPHRNFFRNNQPVKRYADQTNKYSFDLNNMAEKYTFSWQGDGGSDDFKGNPMCFRAGWIDKGKSESHEVDNIFADLDWLMLNAGTDTASSKNRDGLFLFAGYHSAYTGQWIPGAPPLSQYLVLAQNQPMSQSIIINVTIPENYQIYLETYGGTIATFTGDGSAQDIPVNSYLPYLRLNFGSSYQSVTINNIIANDQSGSVFQIASAPNLLHPGNLQNGPLAWPWLQNEFLHYDIPANKWSFDSDDPATATYLATGTIKLVKKQTVGIAPFPTADPKTDQGIKTGLGIGLIDSAKVNIGSRNVELTLLYDINPQNI